MQLRGTGLWRASRPRTSASRNMLKKNILYLYMGTTYLAMALLLQLIWFISRTLPCSWCAVLPSHVLCITLMSAVWSKAAALLNPIPNAICSCPPRWEPAERYSLIVPPAVFVELRRCAGAATGMVCGCSLKSEIQAAMARLVTDTLVGTAKMFVVPGQHHHANRIN